MQVKVSRCSLQASFRGARAAIRLHEYATAVQLAQDGLSLDSSGVELKHMLQVSFCRLDFSAGQLSH